MARDRYPAPGHDEGRPVRTTLTIEPDVAELLRHEQRRSGRSMKFIVNRALRFAMGREAPEPPSRREPCPLPFSRLEAHRQSLAVASSAQARDDQEFVDAVYDRDHE